MVQVEHIGETAISSCFLPTLPIVVLKVPQMLVEFFNMCWFVNIDVVVDIHLTRFSPLAYSLIGFRLVKLIKDLIVILGWKVGGIVFFGIFSFTYSVLLFIALNRVPLAHHHFESHGIWWCLWYWFSFLIVFFI